MNEDTGTTGKYNGRHSRRGMRCRSVSYKSGGVWRVHYVSKRDIRRDRRNNDNNTHSDHPAQDSIQACCYALNICRLSRCTLACAGERTGTNKHPSDHPGTSGLFPTHNSRSTPRLLFSVRRDQPMGATVMLFTYHCGLP